MFLLIFHSILVLLSFLRVQLWFQFLFVRQDATLVAVFESIYLWLLRMARLLMHSRVKPLVLKLQTNKASTGAFKVKWVQNATNNTPKNGNTFKSNIDYFFQAVQESCGEGNDALLELVMTMAPPEEGDLVQMLSFCKELRGKKTIMKKNKLPCSSSWSTSTGTT